MSVIRGDERGPGPELEQDVRTNERRRIARELHDSTSQLLVLAQLQLGQLRRAGRPAAHAILEECQRTIDEIRAEIRSIDPDGLGQ